LSCVMCQVSGVKNEKPQKIRSTTTPRRLSKFEKNNMTNENNNSIHIHGCSY